VHTICRWSSLAFTYFYICIESLTATFRFLWTSRASRLSFLSCLTSVIEPTSVALDDLAQGGSNFVENVKQFHVLVDLWQVDRCEGR
jgi:hypothetical protein